MQTLDTTIVNTALPAMARSLGEDVLALKPVVVAYTLTMAMLTPASGWLADRYGTRRVYLAAILVFAVGSVFCGLAQTLTQLTIARVVQGVGGSMLLPIGRLAVLRRVPGDQYISALAFVSIAGQVGPIFGPTLGGLLVQVASWHWIFMINVPIGLVGLIAVRRYLPEDALADVAPFDVLGCGLLSLCMVSFSLALDLPTGEGRMAWSSALFALSALTVLLYVAHARRRDNPLFQLRLFRDQMGHRDLMGDLCAIHISQEIQLTGLLQRATVGGSIRGVDQARPRLDRAPQRIQHGQRHRNRGRQHHAQHERLAALGDARRAMRCRARHLSAAALPVKDLSERALVWPAAFCTASLAAFDWALPSSPASSRAMAAVCDRTTWPSD